MPSISCMRWLKTSSIPVIEPEATRAAKTPIENSLLLNREKSISGASLASCLRTKMNDATNPIASAAANTVMDASRFASSFTA